MRRALSPALLSVLASFALVQPSTAGDRTYRWTDAQGRVHYSDVKTEKSQPVQVKPSSGVSAAPKDSPAVVAARQQECQRRKDQVALYSSTTSINETDNLGNTRTYSAAERAKLIEKAQKDADTACSTPAASTPAGAAAGDLSRPQS